MAKQKMTKEELEKKSDLYESNIKSWKLYDLIWRSGEELIEYALYRHERESYKNYLNRLRDGYVFNFGKSIVDIYSFYLNQKKVVRDLKGLREDEQWQMFQKDSDLNGTNYGVLINETQKFSSVFGSFGILINKAGNGEVTISEEISNKIYPYYALFSLPNIYDWEWKKDTATHRRYLSYLKLKETGDNYLIWTPEFWQQWTMENKNKQPQLVRQGENPLEEIPFVWMVNVKDLKYPEIGASDLIDISHIVTSIAQNLSCGEEMIKLAGFPIRREPMEAQSDNSDTASDSEEVESGPVAVAQFNPELGEAGKPDWMPTEILEPVEANLKWIDRKTDEIYRIAHLSGVHGQRKSNNEVASGMALRYEFSQLNQVLNSKATNATEAELQALRYWLMWQNKEELFDEMEIKRSTEFSIDELSIALENAITAYKNVVSRTFRKRVMQKITEHVLPDMTQDDKETIETEIEKDLPATTEIIDTNKSTEVRSAFQSRADHSKDSE
jgi:hypothetical protein